ncbi:MAG: hypothetical protein JWO22_1803 [Frankiales bacterium]|nr:hypothetical protein [Frankiales bacterium]
MITSAALIEAAVEQTGLSDFGGDAFREGLDVLVDSLNEEAQLSELGALAVPGQVVGTLANRLKVVDHAARFGTADELIEAPVFVIGLFRAGTTLLSNLLDADPRNRALLTWEAGDSAPPSTPADHRSGERVELNRLAQSMLDGLNPGFKAIHHEEPEGPTECITVLGADFKALVWESVANVPSYGSWLLQADSVSAYEHHKRTLQVLQSGGVRGRWTLKTPHHALALEALTAVYPDARLVYLHRDPVEVAASAFSLVASLSGTFSDADHRAYIAERWTDILVACTDRVDAFRDAHPSVPVHDIRYLDLLGDPVGTVRALYGFLGEDLSDHGEAGMQAHLASTPQGRFGRHTYDLADFGVSAASLRERFAGYLSRYDVTATSA